VGLQRVCIGFPTKLKQDKKANTHTAFVADLLKDPKARSTLDVSHTVTAVASSSSKSRAENFIAELNIPGTPSAYGSYEDLVKDSNVDIVYIATPHSHHYQNARLALESGKHVLCEKAFTVNAAQAKILCELAKEKNLFLMEAVWTRYFPLSIQVREMIQKGEIGEVLRVITDLSLGRSDYWDASHRMINLDLAGGALLDCMLLLLLLLVFLCAHA
jgi:predicted dehydrogenase